MTVAVTKQNYKEEVTQSPKPVLLDFYADWCMPCKLLSPVLEEIAAESPEVKICKINVDHDPELAQSFRVGSIPTLVLIKDGQALQTVTGVLPKGEIQRMLRS